ncbi:hypothetical protein PIB30_056482 [Stylosanthes scabra]|uniref:Uncharacterized protein n=1 Tax=Stylosanthes scabra TaxID=79078 RepID=A0ABU6RJP6_9FABA|nr:hypothetical protein [Stylosanthes scabra]
MGNVVLDKNTKIASHKIPLFSGAEPQKQKSRRMHPDMSLKIKEEVSKQLEAGFLEVTTQEHFECSSKFLKNPSTTTAKPTSFHHQYSHLKLLIIFSSSSIIFFLIFKVTSTHLGRNHHPFLLQVFFILSKLSMSKNTGRSRSKERLRKAIESWCLKRVFGGLNVVWDTTIEPGSFLGMVHGSGPVKSLEMDWSSIDRVLVLSDSGHR